MESAQEVFLGNTLGHEVERFVPLDSEKVTIYTCGPTVYGYAHIGNFRSFILGDTARRMLEFNGFRVVHVRNITDVGHLTNDTLSSGADKIEEMARKQNVRPEDIAQHYTDAFERDAGLLNLAEPAQEPRATEYVRQMIDLIKTLIEREYAYESGGSVYFDVSKFPDYGKLSGNTVEGLIAGLRVEVGEGKRNPADFALWKAAGPEKLMRWDSPWGQGVPGWHIECSAMSLSILGNQIDIHTGGVDNIFPHHEDEIAQSEAATGKQFVRYWLHSAWLQSVGGDKMSKSEGNIYTISDLIEGGIEPLAYRYFTHQAHYRTPLAFNWEALTAADTALRSIWEQLAELNQTAEPSELGTDARAMLERFQVHVNNDLDMPKALAVVHEVLRSKLSPGEKLTLLGSFDRVLGLSLLERAARLSTIAPEEQALLDRRQQARVNKDWKESDLLRQQLANGGLEVKDTPTGQRWIRRDT